MYYLTHLHLQTLLALSRDIRLEGPKCSHFLEGPDSGNGYKYSLRANGLNTLSSRLDYKNSNLKIVKHFGFI
jgi:hypothetical protein